MTRCKFALFALILAGTVFASCRSDVDFTPQDQTRRYRITITPVPQNGVLSLSTNLAETGEGVKVYVNPDPGYRLKGEVQYRFPGGSTSVIWSDMPKPSYYFQLSMGSGEAYVTAEFETAPANQYTVSIDRNIKNGRISSDVNLGTNGDSVTVYDIPDSGYVLKAGSLKALNTTNGNPITSITFPSEPPYTFNLPTQNVTITAEFENGDLSSQLANARNYLKVGQYDTAAGFLEQAYQKRNSLTNDDDLYEMLFYYSFVKLGNILLTPNVRRLMGTGMGNLQFKDVPVALDDWICDSDSGWPGTDGSRWYMTWEGLDYGDDNAGKGYTPDPNSVLWAPKPDLVTEDIVLPKLEVRSGLNINNTMGSGGWFSSFPDDEYIKGLPDSPQKFANMLFWMLLIQNRNNGFNDLLQRIEERFFGTAFEEAARIADQIPAGYQNVPLHPNLINRFDLDKYYGSGTVKVGKAELDYVFGTLRMVKAAVQFLRAYDWTIYLQPYLAGNLEYGEGLDQILNRIFQRSEDNDTYKGYWSNTVTRGSTLPFLNNFLNTRTPGNLSKARTELSNGLNMINSSMTYWHDTGGSFSAQGKADYLWAKNAFAQAKSAVDGQNSGNFDFPKKLPKAGGTWPTAGSGEYAVNVTEFFANGAFNLRNLFVTETSGRRAPIMYKIPWWTAEVLVNDEYERQWDILPATATPVTAAIPNDDSFPAPVTAPAGAEDTRYGLYSFVINTGNLRKIFPRGFEQSKYTTITGAGNTQALFYQVFPTIPLWHERPTYLSGPGNEGNRSAQHLYRYFH